MDRQTIFLLFFWLSMDCVMHVICMGDGNNTDECKGKRELHKVDISKHCSKELMVDYGIVVIPTTLSFSVLQNCLNCTLILRTKAHYKLTATFYSLGTETGPGGKCTDNRLDIYDGEGVNDTNRLSIASGICGCNLPKEHAYESTQDAMTFHFVTACNNETLHGEFDLVVSAVRNENFNKTECRGKFECSDGNCIDKNLICNGKSDCPDGSDEKDCKTKNGSCPGEFECLSGTCIDKNLVCNGKNNCPDRSDEINCTQHGGKCSGMFVCANGHCIDKNLVCNGKNDCKDNSDEKGCKKKHSLLLYVMIGIAALVLLMFIVIVILLCYRYCCSRWRVASAYRRL